MAERCKTCDGHEAVMHVWVDRRFDCEMQEESPCPDCQGPTQEDQNDRSGGGVMAEKLKVEPLVLLLEALDDALTYIEYRANSTPYNEHELQLVQLIKAAIAAAEGE